MGTPNVVPAVENAAEDAAQGRSTIKFPYLDQDDAVTVAKAIHAVAGKSCERDQLAAHFNVAASGGGFNLRLLTAKMFGFINSDGKGTLSLTPLGSRVCDPQQEKAARAESFLLVPLYRAVYDDYKGQMLPGNPGLEAAMEKLGVAPKQKDKARQVFQRSATQAGYFAYGSNRLVAPAIKPVDDTSAPADTDTGAGNGGGGGTYVSPPPPPLHPFIKGLLDKLPEPETEWALEGRKKWLQTALNIFDLMYVAAPTDSGDLSISLPKNSAN
jgi:hypothetical protein